VTGRIAAVFDSLPQRYQISRRRVPRRIREAGRNRPDLCDIAEINIDLEID
jgi:hypothetical protein